MIDLRNKKILVLAGASVHVKLVEAAKSLGCYVIVTDYLIDSPAKRIADEAWNLNISDVDAIVRKCQEVGVQAVISGWIDPCQRYYQEICDKLSLPCLGTKDQFYKMTDKHAFKKMCVESGVGVIPEYTVDDCIADSKCFPVFVKPVDSRGSRGQAVCYDIESLLEAVEVARKESSNGDIIIEKYMADAHEFQVTYFYIDGIGYLIRTVDSYTGEEKDGLNKVVACSISPAACTDQYIESGTNQSVLAMFEKLGIKNGPIFMQGFEKDGHFYFFDPGLRFPGVDFEMIYRNVYGIDLMKNMVYFAFTGKMLDQELPDSGVYLDNGIGCVLFPTLRAGIISKVEGVKELLSRKGVVSISQRWKVGDEIGWTYNVNQRFAEIDLYANDLQSMKHMIDSVQNSIEVYAEDGKDMIYPKFDVTRITDK